MYQLYIKRSKNIKETWTIIIDHPTLDIKGIFGTYDDYQYAKKRLQYWLMRVNGEDFTIYSSHNYHPVNDWVWDEHFK